MLTTFKKTVTFGLIAVLIITAVPAVTYASTFENTLTNVQTTLVGINNYLAATQIGSVLGITIAIPPLQSLEGVNNPSLAYGLSGITDYSTAMPFINITKIMRPWIGHLPGKWGGVSYEELQAGGYLDNQGWVKKIPSNVGSVAGVFAWSDEYGSDKSRAGRYVMTYKGEGTINVGLITGSQIVSRAPGKIVFDIKPDQGNWMIEIKTTDPNQTGNYIRDIEIVREDLLPLHQAGALFNPDYLALIKDARIIRFMDIMNTNGSEKKSWSEQPVELDDVYTYADDMPIAAMVQLANEIGADPWFNMPFLANDEYVRNFAKYIKDNLDPSLTAYVELSNEVWNWSFKQARQSHDAGIKAWGLTKETEGASWVNYMGKRSYEVMKIWTEVYGPKAEKQLKRVAPTQTVSPWVSEQVLLAPMWKQYDPATYVAPYTMFDVLSPTLYFGGSLVGNETQRNKLFSVLNNSSDNGFAFHRDLLLKPQNVRGTMSILKSAQGAFVVTGSNTKFLEDVPKDGVLFIKGVPYRLSEVKSDTEFRLQERYFGETVTNEPVTVYNQDSIASIVDYLADQKKLADKYGLQVVPYEGGQHIHHSFAVSIPSAELEKLQNHLIGFIRSSEMAELYQAMWDGWKGLNAGPFMQFVEAGQVSKYGSWGLRASLADETPRVKLMDRLQNTPAWWGETGGTHYQQGRTVTAQGSAATLSGTVAEDYLVGSTGNDVFYPGPGNDGVNGGAGEDTVILRGAENQYTITKNGEVTLVTGPDGSDKFYSVEAFKYTEAVPVVADPIVPPVIPTPPTDPVVETPTTPVAGTVNPTYAQIQGRTAYQVTPSVSSEGMNVHSINQYSLAGKALKLNSDLAAYSVHNAKKQVKFGTENVSPTYWSINDNVVEKNGRQLSNDPIKSTLMFGDIVVGKVAITGTQFRDDMRGRDQDDVFYGGAGDDWISTDAGEDTIRGEAGNDAIDGGKGRDTLELSGAQTAYTIESSNDQFRIAGPDGSDRVKNIELVRFLGSNQLILLSDWVKISTQVTPGTVPVVKTEDLVDATYSVLRDLDTYQAEPEFGDGVNIYSINRWAKTGKEIGITSTKPAYHVIMKNKKVTYVGETLRPDYWTTNDNQRSQTNVTPITNSALSTALLFGNIVFGNTLMKGTKYDDDIRGREQNDNFDAGLGDDLVLGEGGDDTLYLNGSRNQYEVLAVKDWFTHLVTGPDGIDKVTGIEYLYFKQDGVKVPVSDMLKTATPTVLGASLIDGVETITEKLDRGEFVEVR